jgi:hypothetical protein
MYIGYVADWNWIQSIGRNKIFNIEDDFLPIFSEKTA